MISESVALVYPHQLWKDNPAVRCSKIVFLVEDPLFFSQYHFHCQKLILHRATMTEYAKACNKSNKKVHLVSAADLRTSSDIGILLKKHQVQKVIAVDPSDDWLKQRVTAGCTANKIALQWLDDPAFLTPTEVIEHWAENRSHFSFTDFYIQQRKRLGLLLDNQSKPIGGKWSFDTENRKRLPKKLEIPPLEAPRENPSVREAKAYVAKHFPNAIGAVDRFIYPVTYDDASEWLGRFVEQRLEPFGDYEDAISSSETFVFHSVLTPMLNVGLIEPQQIISAVTDKLDSISFNSMEGFVRQVIGWREFVRLVYLRSGSKQRTCNFWKLSQKLPASFYTGNTGIVPFDHAIKRVLKNAYCHHIERLMVLGNFMLLCDIAPDSVYQWFMELFIDSYDWVMVPNVYGMSQYADGGLMTTKPYISGSNYILKMSDYSKGPWCEIWIRSTGVSSIENDPSFHPTHACRSW